MEPIIFDAVVSKVTTLVDGGIRITFDLPENAIPQTAQLMECKRNETPLRVAIASEDGNGTKRNTL